MTGITFCLLEHVEDPNGWVDTLGRNLKWPNRRAGHIIQLRTSCIINPDVGHVPFIEEEYTYGMRIRYIATLHTPLKSFFSICATSIFNQ